MTAPHRYVLTPLPMDSTLWTVNGHLVQNVYRDGYAPVFAYTQACNAGVFGVTHDGFVRLFDGSYQVCSLCEAEWERRNGATHDDCC